MRKQFEKASKAAIERQNPELASAMRKLQRVGPNPDPQRAQQALSQLSATERRAYLDAIEEQGGDARAGEPRAAAPPAADGAAERARAGELERQLEAQEALASSATRRGARPARRERDAVVVAPALVEERPERLGDLVERLVRAVDDAGHAQEAVDHPVVAVALRLDAGEEQPLRVRLGLVAQDVGLGGDDDRARQPPQVVQRAPVTCPGRSLPS